MRFWSNTELKKGTPISDIDTNMISEKVLSDYNGKIAWMWLGVRGTVLEVRVKEMERTPLEYTDTADIIAADDWRGDGNIGLRGRGIGTKRR